MKHTVILFVHVLLANMLQTALAADVRPPSMFCKTFGVFIIRLTETEDCAARRMIDSISSLFRRLYSQCGSHQYGPALSHTISTCLGTGAEIRMVPPSDVDDDLLRARGDDNLAGRQMPEIPSLLNLQQESAGTAPVPPLTLDTTPPVPATLLNFATPAMPTTSCITTTPLPPLPPIPPLTAGMPLPQPIATTTATVVITTTAPAALQGPYQYFSSPSYHNNGSDDASAGAGPSAGADLTSSTRPLVSPVSEAKNLTPSSYTGLVFWIAIAVAQDVWLQGR
ncbi:hypothetical protein DL771_004730 [Monosporascus sp. 5C6A]|nr:hypothetical protein DL771_004730 [Monosporascus sp. 5C6A]